MIFISDKIEVRKSPIHGWGVFAKEDIPENTTIESSHAILYDIKPETDNILYKYRFGFPNAQEPLYYAIPLGYGCIYNHNDESNMMWECDEKNKIYNFITIKHIKKDEEVCHYYGDKLYWDALNEYIKKYE